MLNKPVDPTLYIDRFADRLNFGSQGDLNKVANTARRLIASMKRDWIQTGRRPSGICGAALYIACHVHGFMRSKRDVVTVVHIGEHTLARRLDEFASTTAGELTFESFENHARALEAETQLLLQDAPPEEAPSSLAIEAAKTGCEHLRGNEPHFAHGMCRQCFADFVRISGGMYNGANPPAFARNRRAEEKVGEKPLALPGPEDEEEAAERANIRDEIEKALEDEQFAPFVGLLQGAEALNEEADMREAEERRKKPLPAKKRARGGFAAVLAKAKAAMVEMENIDDEDARIGSAMAALDDDNYLLEQAAAAAAAGGGGNEGEGDDDEGDGAGPSTSRAARAQATTTGSLNAETGAIVAVGGNHQRHQGDDDDGNLSDISDEDILEYLAAEEEIKCKEEIWNIMNKEWVEKQAAKRAAVEATQKTLEEQQAAMEAAAAAGVAYKRSRGRPLGSKSKPKPELKLPASITAEDAAMKMLEHKKLSTKINYNVLKNLFATDGLTADKDQNVDANKGGVSKERERKRKKIVGKKRRRGAGKDSSPSSSSSSSSDSDSDSSSNSSSSSSSSSSDSSDSDTESDDKVAGKDKGAIGKNNKNNKNNKKVSTTLPKSAAAGKQPSSNTMGNNKKPLPPVFAKKKKQTPASITAERVAAVVKKGKEKADNSGGDGEPAFNRRATRSSGTTGGTSRARQAAAAAAAATRRSRPGALGSLKDDFRSKLVGSGGSKGLGLTQKGILGTSKLPPSFKKPKRRE